MTPELRRALGSEARCLFGLETGERALDRLEAYGRELIRWNARLNLVSAHSEEELVFRHLLDSLAPIGLLPPAGDIVDVGSGAGLPGLPIAIVTGRPVVLLESRRRRASFLRHAVRTLGLANVSVLETRAEDTILERAPIAVVARAVPAEVATAFATRVLDEGGVLLLLVKQGQEVSSGDLEPCDRFAYELPGGWSHEAAPFRKCFT